MPAVTFTRQHGGNNTQVAARPTLDSDAIAGKASAVARIVDMGFVEHAAQLAVAMHETYMYDGAAVDYLLDHP